MDIPHRLGVLTVLVLFLTIGGAATFSTAGAQQAGNASSNVSITVGASGTVSAPPDVAVIDLVVESTAGSASEARRMAAENVSAVRDALSAVNVTDDQIRTTSFFIQTERDDNGSVTYRAVHALEVRVPVDDAGATVDAAVDGGATRVDGVRFTLVDATRQELRAEALRSALDDARADADVIADATGVEVRAVRSVETGDRGVEPVVLESARDGQTTFDPGPVTVSASVTVTYQAS
jgi:uncharacterized protein YggE